MVTTGHSTNRPEATAAARARYRGARALVHAGALLTVLAGCSIIADNSLYSGWPASCFIRNETFANQPLPGWGGRDAATNAGSNKDLASTPGSSDALVGEAKQQCPVTGIASPDRNKLPAPSVTIAATDVPWDIDATCRNGYLPQRNPDGSRGAPVTRAEVLRDCPRTDRNFIALGISGGGTKSAVFATEGMLALDQWGLLDQLDMISSVSGGSFAAALYALSCDVDEFGDRCDEGDGQRLRWPNWNSPAPLMGLPSDPLAHCFSSNGSGRSSLCGHAELVGDRAQVDLLLPFLLRRFDLLEQFNRAVSHRKSSNVLADSLDVWLLGRPLSFVGVDVPYFGAIDLDSLMTVGPDRENPLQFRHLNPRRPNLVLNTTNVTSDRQYLERDAEIPAAERRLTASADRTHFEFSDYYFNRLLHSDIATYPVSHAVAASAAFPAIVDYITVGRFNRPGQRGNAWGIDFVHLTDGGTQDNHGLTSIRLALESIFGRPQVAASPAKAEQPPASQPKRVLAMVLDASLTDLGGLSGRDPYPLGLDSALSPLRVKNIDQTSSLLLATNAAQHDQRFREYLKQSVESNCNDNGPQKEGAVCARTLRIGFEQLDAYDSVVLDDGRHYRCTDARAQDYLAHPPAEDAEDVDMEAWQRASLHCKVMRVLRTPEARERLSLGRYHPQCYVEATREAGTSYSIGGKVATCLRHAARWAVATKMLELCADAKFGGSPALLDASSAANGKTLPLGPSVHCPLPEHWLPPVDEECDVAQVLQTRPRDDQPRDTAHCSCPPTGPCVPEEL